MELNTAWLCSQGVLPARSVYRAYVDDIVLVAGWPPAHPLTSTNAKPLDALVSLSVTRSSPVTPGEAGSTKR
jgi:hypothetical protein